MDIKLPQLGEGADSGTVVNVFVKPGDQVRKNQPLIELENEKAVASIPSPESGTVTAVHVQEGQTISVGHTILSLSKEGEAAEAPPSKPSESTPPSDEQQQEQQEEKPQERPAKEEAVGPAPSEQAGLAAPASPTIRKLAQQLGIDLRRVRGSQRGGRIVMEDLRAYIAHLQERTAERKPAEPRRTETPAPDFAKWGPVRAQALSSLRKTIAQRMTESWRTIPHVTQFDEADITALLELKARMDEAYEQRKARLTLTAFVLKAVVKTLKANPVFNTSVDEAGQQLIYKDYYHIGLAVATEAGLVVPVIRDVDKKTMLELSKEIHDVAERTRQRKVSAEELRGGTFTVSNQGGIGGAHFTPIIRKPEVAVLGVGRGRAKPILAPTNALASRIFLPLALSYDHRVIDGADAAQFIRDLVKALEEFDERDVKI